jgi:alpha-beta hydrolase superfamily lysophospholipase
MANAPAFRPPLLCLTGDADVIADPRASARFVERAGSSDKTLKTYPGHKHELLREAERETIFASILAWMTRIADPRESSRSSGRGVAQ